MKEYLSDARLTCTDCAGEPLTTQQRTDIIVIGGYAGYALDSVFNLFKAYFDGVGMNELKRAAGAASGFFGFLGPLVAVTGLWLSSTDPDMLFFEQQFGVSFPAAS